MTVARMSLADILWLYRARLRARAVLVQECFAILGIAVGVALLFASQVASTSLSHSVSQLTNQIVGRTQLQLEARGPGGFSERLLQEVNHMPGVQLALPVLEQQANVIGPEGQQRPVDLIGTDPRFARFTGTLLQRFSASQLAAQRAIALPAPLAEEIGVGPLQTIKIQIGASVMQTLLGATLSEGDIGGLVHSPVALAPVHYAQSLAGMKGRITRIFVQAAPARVAAVRAGLQRLAGVAPVMVEPSNFDSQLFRVAVGPESQSETLFSVISALVGFMFALNAMLVTVPSRRNLIADIRPQGATRLMTVQILLFDAAVLGVLACLLGLVLGDLLSIAVFHATPGYLSFAFPVGNERIVTWQSVVLAVLAGLAAAIAGVLWPLRDIFAQPLEGSSKAPHKRWIHARLAIGVLCLLVTTLILALRPQSGFVGIVALVLALVCLLPPLFDGLVALFDRTQRALDGAATVLAVTELQTRETRVRSLAIAATAAVAVFGTVEFQGTQSNLKNGLESSARQLDDGADVWVSASGASNAFATTPFSDVNSRALARLPGVGELGVYRGGFLNWGDRRLWVVAPPSSIAHPIPASQLVSGKLGLADAALRHGAWVALSQALAAQEHLHIGQYFTLPSPQPQRMRVAALISNLGWPPGAIIMGSQAYAAAWASEDPSAYMVQARPGVSPASLRRQLQHGLGPNSGLVVETAAERERRHYTLANQGLSRLTQIRLLVLIAAVLAVAGAMCSMIWQRRDLVAFIKCQGYRRAVLWRWLLCESAVLLVAGCSIGAVFGLYAQLLGSHFLASVTGFPIVFAIEPIAALSSFALLTVVAVAVMALPGYLVVRVPPRTANPAF